MADVKISQLPSATTPLAGTEVLPIVQGGVTSKVSAADMTAGRAVSMSSATVSTGNLTFGSTAQRITGDFSNATIANRTMFQNSVTNGPSNVQTLPNGTGTTAGFLAFANSDPSNTNFAQIAAVGPETRVSSGITGTGTYQPMTFYTGGSERVRIDTAGNVGVGTSSPASKLTVSGTLAAGGIRIQDSDDNAAAPVLEIIGQRLDANGSVSFAGKALLARHRTDAAIAANINLGGLFFGGNHTSSSASNILYSASVTAFAEGTFTSSSNMPTALSFLTGSTGISPDTANVAAGTERMRIASNGIVTMNAYGAGTATFSAAGVISSVSDETWKTKDGVPVDPDSMLKKLKPGYWYYNDEKKEIFGADRQLGFYAQNVNAAIGPEAAPEPEEGKPWGYHDRSVLAVVVMSLQKALSTIESLEARIAALEAK